MTAQYQVQAGCGIVTGSDGVHRVGIQMAGPMNIGLMIDPDQADAFADALAADIKAKAADARRANLGIGPTGLLIPTGVQLPPPNGGPNGHSPLLSG